MCGGGLYFVRYGITSRRRVAAEMRDGVDAGAERGQTSGMEEIK